MQWARRDYLISSTYIYVATRQPSHCHCSDPGCNINDQFATSTSSTRHSGQPTDVRGGCPEIGRTSTTARPEDRPSRVSDCFAVETSRPRAPDRRKRRGTKSCLLVRSTTVYWSAAAVPGSEPSTAYREGPTQQSGELWDSIGPVPLPTRDRWFDPVLIVRLRPDSNWLLSWQLKTTNWWSKWDCKTKSLLVKPCPPAVARERLRFPQ